MVTCQDAENFHQHFHYHSIKDKINHLENSTRPEIAYAVHQCAQL